MDSRRVILDVDQGTASVARVYDVLLGGDQNHQVDRELAGTLESRDPTIRALAQANRSFLGRVVRFLLKAGVRQFLDLGSGLPTMGHVHEVAQADAPDARVVYVDSDASTVAHGAALLADNGSAAIVHGDLREPGEVLDSPLVRDLIDIDQPVAILALAILHVVPDVAALEKITDALRSALPTDSYLAISHAVRPGEATDPPVPAPPLAAGVAGQMTQGGARSAPEIKGFFRGCTFVDPGLVPLPLWRPEPHEERPAEPERFPALGGVARKRG